MGLDNILKKSFLSIAVPLAISSCVSTKSADAVLDYNSSHTQVSSFRFDEPSAFHFDINSRLDYFPFVEYNLFARSSRFRFGVYANFGRYSRNRDSDGDGIVNFYDLAPFAYGPHVDMNGNGYPDAFDTYIGTPFWGNNSFLAYNGWGYNNWLWQSPYRYPFYAYNNFNRFPRYNNTRDYATRNRTRRSPYRQNNMVRSPLTRSSQNTTRANPPRSSANIRNLDRGRSSSSYSRQRTSPRNIEQMRSNRAIRTPPRTTTRSNANTRTNTYRTPSRSTNPRVRVSTPSRTRSSQVRSTPSRSSSRSTVRSSSSQRSSAVRSNTKARSSSTKARSRKNQ